MTDRPFRVIDGGGKPEPDARIIEALELMLGRAREGEFEGVLIVGIPVDWDDEPEGSVAGDDPLATLTHVELMLPALKLRALGYEVE